MKLNAKGKKATGTLMTAAGITLKGGCIILKGNSAVIILQCLTLIRTFVVMTGRRLIVLRIVEVLLGRGRGGLWMRGGGSFLVRDRKLR